MRIRVAVPDQYLTPEVIEGALELATRANHAMLNAGKVPAPSSLIARGMKWLPEPRYPDGEHFDLIHQIAGRGWGDCDDWAPAFASELRATKEDPGARAIIRRTGDRSWHALLQTSDGEIHDPSRWAGMPFKGASTFQPPVASLKFPTGVSGAFILPTNRGWSARCDMPMAHYGHVVGVAHNAQTPEDAFARAVLAVAPAHADGRRVMDVGSMIVGFDLGGFLGDAVKVAAPLAGTALGGPLGGMAGAALGQALGGALSGGGGGGGGSAVPGPGGAAAPPAQPPGGGPAQMPLPGGGHVAYHPGGPIIVRF